MTERTELIFDALEKIYAFNKSLKLGDGADDIYVHVGKKNYNSNHIWRLIINLNTGRSYLSRFTWGNKTSPMHYTEFPILFNEEQRETFVEDYSNEFLWAAERLILDWDRIKCMAQKRRDQEQFRLSRLNMSPLIKELLASREQLNKQINEEKLRNFIA